MVSPTPSMIEEVKRLMDGSILDHEKPWIVVQKPLEEHGYLLRPRFRPGWIPSWLNTNENPRDCEDFHFNMHRKTIDATRLSDGVTVCFKQVFNVNSNEVSIGIFLSSEDKINDPRNHCVPILDVVALPTLPNWRFIVMPLLRRFYDPPFFSVDEVLDFIKQTLEGLSFMHQHGVAHRDAAKLNIMFDGKGMYPRGFHPAAQMIEPDFKRVAKPLRRRDVPCVKYYFTDFGISTWFTDANRPHLVLGEECQDREVPELSGIHPYNPFAVDIFTLGNLYKHEFVEKYPNLSFLGPLVQAMTQRDPRARLKVDEAIKQFEGLVLLQPGYKQRWHLKITGESKLSQFFMDVASVKRECFFLTKRFFSTQYSIMPGLSR